LGINNRNPTFSLLLKVDLSRVQDSVDETLFISHQRKVLKGYYEVEKVEKVHLRGGSQKGNQTVPKVVRLTFLAVPPWLEIRCRMPVLAHSSQSPA
jgi:hypothetical protein